MSTKTLKFADNLPNLILTGQKDTTWRLNDDKNLSPNDNLTLIRKETKEPFATAKILWTKETTFENLTKEDKEGHEPFKDQQEMIDTYKRYYNTTITKQTKLKVVKFQLLQKTQTNQAQPLRTN